MATKNILFRCLYCNYLLFLLVFISKLRLPANRKISDITHLNIARHRNSTPQTAQKRSDKIKYLLLLRITMGLLKQDLISVGKKISVIRVYGCLFFSRWNLWFRMMWNFVGEMAENGLMIDPPFRRQFLYFEFETY